MVKCQILCKWVPNMNPSDIYDIFKHIEDNMITKSHTKTLNSNRIKKSQLLEEESNFE